MTPQEIRNLRLKHDYIEMVNIRGNIIQWEATKGIPPFVEEYKLIINIKSIIGSDPQYRDKHEVHVVLPGTYPNSAPDVRMITKPFVFHPNWFSDGKWCFGTWNISEGLGYHIIRMINTLQYDREITNEGDPANSDANTFYKDNLSSGIFPCDNTDLPDPSQKAVEPKTHKKFEIKEKKKFRINE